MYRSDELEPAFSEPWQAELFAVTHTLASGDHFAWVDWTKHLATALKSAKDTGAPEDSSNYYDTWLVAFEDFLIMRGLADVDRLVVLKSAWIDAYLATPHGEAVELD